MSKLSMWSKFFYPTVFLLAIVSIILTWTDPQEPTRLNMTLWIFIAIVWMATGLKDDMDRGDKNGH